MHRPSCSSAVHRMHTHPQTHPPAMLGFACDKQPQCEVWSVFLSHQWAVSVWGCSEWWIEMARRHRAAVQVDSAKPPVPKLSPPSYTVAIIQHLSVAALCFQQPVKNELQDWIRVLIDEAHTDGPNTRDRQRNLPNPAQVLACQKLYSQELNVCCRFITC